MRLHLKAGNITTNEFSIYILFVKIILWRMMCIYIFTILYAKQFIWCECRNYNKDLIINIINAVSGINTSILIWIRKTNFKNYFLINGKEKYLFIFVRVIKKMFIEIFFRSINAFFSIFTNLLGWRFSIAKVISFACQVHSFSDSLYRRSSAWRSVHREKLKPWPRAELRHIF